MKSCCFPLIMILCIVTGLTAQNWSGLDQGLNDTVYTIVPYSDGLYVGGAFTNAGGNPDADYLARWDGAQWHSVLAGLNGPVFAILVDHDLDIISYIGGKFTLPSNWLMQYNPDDGWIAFSSGLKGPVRHLEQNNTQIFAAGNFQENIVYFDDDAFAWLPLGGGLNGRVNALTKYGLNLDTLIVGGAFTDAGGIGTADNIALWDGEAWQTMGTLPHITEVYDLVTDNSDIYISGKWIGGCSEPDPDPITRWDGEEFHDVGFLGGCRDVGPLALYGGLLYATAYDPEIGEEVVFMYDPGAESWIGWLTWFVYDGSAHLSTMVVDKDGLYLGGGFIDHEVENGDNIVRWGDQVLAHQLLTFTAEYQEPKQVLLTWFTGPGSDSELFTVQCAGDSFVFEDIGHVNATSLQYVEQRYTLLDDHPQMGNNHYRLLMRDAAGMISHSNIVTVKVYDPHTGVFYYPNPVQETLVINYGTHEKTEVTLCIYDALQRCIYEDTRPIGESVIDMRLFVADTYFIKVALAEHQSAFTIVKE